MRLIEKPVILYHGNCSDGFTAAWIAHQVFGDEAKYVPCFYGQPPYEHQPLDGDVYLLDFSYKMDGMHQLHSVVKDKGFKLYVIDHHESALRELSAWISGLQCEGTDEEKSVACNAAFLNPGGRTTLGYETEDLCLIFDLSESGASLAWKYFFSKSKLSPLVWYVRERDLGYFTGAKGPRIPDVDEVSAYIETIPKEFSEWESLETRISDDLEGVINSGAGALALKRQVVSQACANVVPITLAGHRGAAVNASAFFSDIAGELNSTFDDVDFGAVFFRRPDGKWQFSLRSKGEFRVNDIAVQFGGGGHPNAAGFEIDDLKEVGL